MLRVGFACVDITPGSDCSLAGYQFRQEKYAHGNAGVHDPLFARVLVLREGNEKPAVLASLDLCLLETSIARDFREAIAAKLNTDVERIILACTHTHSGPWPETEETVKHWAKHDDISKYAPEIAYTKQLKVKLLDACVRAEGLTYPVEASFRDAPFGLGYNRRVILPEGERNCWSPQEFPERPPTWPTDPTLTLLMFRRTVGTGSYLLWDIGVHPVTLGKTSNVISADYPGRTCRILDESASGVKSLFFLGAAADAHPWIATQEDPARIEPVAQAAASMVALLSQATEILENPVLRFATSTVTIGKSDMDLCVWRLGKVWIVSAPVELFGELAMDLRKRLGGPVMLISNSNGWEGYWPTRHAFAEGGYEIDAAKHNLQPGDGEKLIEELLKVAEGLR
jgi:hypothetical protein